MDVLKFGFHYWKKHLDLAILSVLMSFAGLTADLMLPMITALFINHIIGQEEVDDSNVFSFMLDGTHGQIHTMELFWNLVLLFVCLLLIKQVLVYTKGVLNQKLGLQMETELRMVTFHKLMQLDSDTIAKYNTGELLTIINSDTMNSNRCVIVLRMCFRMYFLFSNTIDSNIAYSHPDIEQEQVVNAAKHAQAHGFIQRLQDGYETIVGERGIGISGGQKQRVSIARALLKDAPVLVLDDSTSALDVDTERQLLADIKENYPQKTLLITAHRVSSVVYCDEICYMQDGRIVERDTFEELMALDGHFAAVYNIQQAQQKSVIDFDAMAGGVV